MSKRRIRIYESGYPNDPPEWYWINGLHDACITMTEEFEFPFDYDRYIGEKSNYNRKLLTLKLNAKGALYDQKVKEIRFFNYKILSDQVTLKGRKQVWWLADRLTKENGQYILEIELQDFSSFPQEFTFKIKFERAEVDRV